MALEKNRGMRTNKGGGGRKYQPAKLELRGTVQFKGAAAFSNQKQRVWGFSGMRDVN